MKTKKREELQDKLERRLLELLDEMADPESDKDLLLTKAQIVRAAVDYVAKVGKYKEKLYLGDLEDTIDE